MALADALRDAELDDPEVLTSFPRGTLQELDGRLGITACGAPSGAASSSPSSTTYGHGVPVQAVEWDENEVKGGNPTTVPRVRRSDHSLLTTDDDNNMGGNPRTVPRISSADDMGPDEGRILWYFSPIRGG